MKRGRGVCTLIIGNEIQYQILEISLELICLVFGGSFAPLAPGRKFSNEMCNGYLLSSVMWKKFSLKKSAWYL